MPTWDDRADRFEKAPVRTAASGVVRVWMVVVVALVLIAITGAVMWAAGVFASDIKGQGDAEKIKNSAPNRIKAQEEFEKRYADIVATDRKIGIAYEQLQAKPGDQRLQTEYSGLRQYCAGVVGEYNAAARSYTKEQFKAVDLPDEITDARADTDCKENAK